MTPVMKVISMLGGYGGAFWIGLAVTMIVLKRTRWVGIAMGTSMALSGIITNLILKKIMNRPRPFDSIQGLVPEGTRPTDASFPSGHAALGCAVATVMVLTLPWIIEKKRAHQIAAVFIVVAVLLSFSRLYLGVHYPTDVLVGMLLGVVYGIVAKVVIGKIRERFSRTDDSGTASSSETRI